MPVPLLEVSGIGKTFGGHRVLDDVSFRIEEGEFVALLGANGAGKSTLIKILDGIHVQDTGSIRISGERVKPGSRDDLTKVGVVHQDLGLVGNLSVQENLRLGLPASYFLGPVLHLARERAAAREALATVGLEDLDLHAKAGTLGLGPRTLLAVAKLLYRGAKVVIADETTSTMTPSEVEWFTGKLRSHLDRGAAVIMVSHKLSEILTVAERYLILRDGRLVADRRRSQLTRESLAELVVGATPAAEGPASIADRAGQPPVLHLDDVHTEAVGPIRLSASRGSITGITGLTTSGLYDVALAAAGATPLTQGRIEKAPGLRIALVPPDRDTQGSLPDHTIRENVTLGALARWLLPGSLIDLRAEKRAAEQTTADLHVSPLDLNARQSTLSGGNQQKVLIGRALLRNPDVLILCEPTRGVDFRTRAQIHRLIRGVAARGVAIILVTTDGEELVALSDTVHVLRDGVLHGVQSAGALDAASVEVLL